MLRSHRTGGQPAVSRRTALTAAGIGVTAVVAGASGVAAATETKHRVAADTETRHRVGAAETLRETDYADACPIATVALEVSSVSEPLREACAGVFEGWIAAGAERFAAAGIEQAGARRLAIGMIAALEGAFVLSRALRSTEPLDIAGELAADAVRSALI